MNRIAAITSSVLVLIVVVIGLIIAGTPVDRRNSRLDQQRVENLRSLSAFINGYWERNGELPPTLSELMDGTRIASVPVDPETGNSYEYRIAGQNTYQLCAVFTREASEDPRQAFWHHPAGRNCYAFEATSSGFISPFAAPITEPGNR